MRATWGERLREPNRDVRRSSKFLRGWQWVGAGSRGTGKVARANVEVRLRGGFDWAGEVATRQELPRHRSSTRCLSAFSTSLHRLSAVSNRRGSVHWIPKSRGGCASLDTVNAGHQSSIFPLPQARRYLLGTGWSRVSVSLPG